MRTSGRFHPKKHILQGRSIPTGPPAEPVHSPQKGFQTLITNAKTTATNDAKSLPNDTATGVCRRVQATARRYMARTVGPPQRGRHP